jgi:hypothetical protein
VGAKFSTPVQTVPGAHSASSTTGTQSFPWVKMPGLGVNQPLPTSFEFEEQVELYLFSLSVPSRQVIGQTLPLPLPFTLKRKCLWYMYKRIYSQVEPFNQQSQFLSYTHWGHKNKLDKSTPIWVCSKGQPTEEYYILHGQVQSGAARLTFHCSFSLTELVSFDEKSCNTMLSKLLCPLHIEVVFIVVVNNSLYWETCNISTAWQWH